MKLRKREKIEKRLTNLSQRFENKIALRKIHGEET